MEKNICPDYLRNQIYKFRQEAYKAYLQKNFSYKAFCEGKAQAFKEIFIIMFPGEDYHKDDENDD